MAKAKKIKVHVGQLNQQVEVKSTDKGTTLDSFLEANGFTFSSTVRVNMRAVRASYVLEENDIVTVLDDVDGGQA